MGLVSATMILVVGLAYAVVLGFGFASLTSIDQPIGNPFFTILELLILLLAPAMVTLMGSVYAFAPRESKGLGLVALSFMAMMAVITCSVHFIILTLSGQPNLAGQTSAGGFLAFKWPSVIYALDILAWDVLFALAMLFAAPVFTGPGLHRAIRISMIASGALALAGLIGPVVGDMALRNIGIAGYLAVFLLVDGLLFKLFLRSDGAKAHGR